jgi:hypothetical protein
MATFRGASSVTNLSGASFTVAKPAGLQEGDVQLAFIATDGDVVTSVISGGATWTLVDRLFVTNGDANTFALFWQVAGASEPATYDVSTGFNWDTSVLILAYSGVDNTTPIATQLATNPDSGSPPSSPVSIAANAITTTADNQMVVWFGGVDWNSSSAADFTDPASTTRRAIENGAGWSNALAVDFVQASAGSTGTVTGTGTLAAASGNFLAWMVALEDSGSSPQTAAPESTISSGNWVAVGAASLHEATDEASPSDSDYCIDISPGSTMEVKYTALTDPASSTGHIVHYRVGVAFGTLTVSLRQGSGTQIAELGVHSGPLSPTTFAPSLSSGQADSITDYTDLRLRLVSSM